MLAGTPLTGERAVRVCRAYFIAGFFGLPWMWGMLYLFFSHFRTHEAPHLAEEGILPLPPSNAAEGPDAELLLIEPVEREACDAKRSLATPLSGPETSLSAVLKINPPSDPRCSRDGAESSCTRTLNPPPTVLSFEVWLRIQWYIRWSRALFLLSVALYITIYFCFLWFLPPSSVLWGDFGVSQFLGF